MTQCRYRKQAMECMHEVSRGFDPCRNCLLAQQIDTMELQVSAMANLTASLEEIIADNMW